MVKGLFNIPKIKDLIKDGDGLKQEVDIYCKVS
jgi:hypothetical protein